MAGCAVGPNFHRPPAPENAGYQPEPLPAQTTGTTGIPGGDAERFVMGRDISFAWWKTLGSAKLDGLVDLALKNNPQLPAAQAALKEAQELTAAQRGYFYPTIGGDYQPNHQQLAGNLGGNAPGVQGNGQDISAQQTTSGPPFNQPAIYSFFTSTVSLSYVPDIFGANRRQVETAAAQAEQTRFQMEATYITLADNVVAAAVQEGSLNDQIAAVRAFIADNQHALDIVRGQYETGYASRADVAAQETALAQAKALLPPLQKQLEQTHDLIRALVGDLPNAQLDMTFSLADFHLPQELPVSLPSKLIEQRPDIREAEAQMHAASAQVGVAIAARLPQITLTASAGGAAAEVTQMFAHGGPFWFFGADIAQTIFDGGTLRHRQKAAEQALVQAGAQYRSAVITAFQNTADTLHAIQSDADGLAAAADAEKAARTSLDVARGQYETGYVNYLTLLSAQEAYQQAVIARVQAATNRYGDAAALFQALGGGWWNRG